jgi:DNA repair protein RecO (recombination protein O)
MPLLTAECTVLQTFPYSETSKILRLFTRDHGVISAIARGALRPKSQYGGMLEPFTEGVAHLYVKHGRELQNLSGFELSRSRQALGRDLLRFGGASLLSEIVLRTASEEPEPGLYDPFCAALQRIETASTEELENVLLAETWSLVGRLGFAPSLEACVQCSRTLAEDEDATFDYSAGGVRCHVCSSVIAGRSLPAQARLDLMHFTRGIAVPLERTPAHWALLGKFLAHHVIEGAPLRSLTFLAEVLERDACAS